MNELRSDEQQKYAQLISEITHSEPNMLPLTVDEVLGKNYIGIMHHEKDGVIAFAAISKPEKNKTGRYYGEVGMMYTVPHLRKQGVGHLMLEYIQDWARGSGKYDGLVAFLCEASIRLFAEAGYKADDGVVPQYYFDLCKTHCELHKGAEENMGFVRSAEIAIKRCEKRQVFYALMDKYNNLDDSVSKIALKILEGNIPRARLCCPLPVYKNL